MKADFTIAVHALVYLHHREVRTSSAEIAANVCTNAARVRKILAKLRAAGLLRTKEGAEGGYEALPETSSLTLLQVLDACEERLVEPSWLSGNAEMTCLIASGMAGVMSDLYADLNEVCRARLAEVRIGAIEEQLFGRKPG